ncbi:MAG: gamma-glutamylcyclotransferase family protein [Myxococcota bacterium]|nr:gamma-glutamylcyclotransferase family protein [Myxococcota bacterium]
MRPKADARRIFTYGTLAAPEVMEALLGWCPPARPAVLEDHARYALRGRDYPGLVAEPGARTEGLLYEGLEAPAMARLDHFEGNLYERRVVHVHTTASERALAEVYVVPEAGRHLLAGDAWDLEHFRRTRLAEWVRHCRALHRPAAEELALREPAR